MAGCVVFVVGVSAALAEMTLANSNDPVKSNSFFMVVPFAFRPPLAAREVDLNGTHSTLIPIKTDTA
jgi:hypothetical protein